MIFIGLPSKWMPYGDNADGENTDGFGLSLSSVTGKENQWTSLGENTAATASYIEVRANFRGKSGPHCCIGAGERSYYNCYRN